ncbi:MAG: response regulator transcription factor [Bryobacterales bacterium]|nr:response regulator transcription factor [Bryobacterales bacterium]
MATPMNIPLLPPNPTGDLPYRLLLVEDSHPMQRRLGAVLAQLPAVELVGVTDTAGGAMSMIRSELPHLVVLDLRLSEGTGFDVLRRLRHMHLATKVFVLSNLAQEAIKEECLAEGATACFDKALEFEEFFTTLQTILRRPAVGAEGTR